jgi:hypothetical protein
MCVLLYCTPPPGQYALYTVTGSWNLGIPYLHVYEPHFFGQEFTLQNWGAAYTQNMFF